mmetsp:Transcript_44824/g.54246  ORF Transcript_44824/g.54246 Transcript_44824/m.54246 type:complete len:198 (-) Transcript_44824:459-1052(-)|eukprot:CAMPEP_0172499432 /NCGR_PEP_ID=MMETSP1066-20121228/127042_1 /TAXON_ID=671091 /ORGANISM="Coscinodiscus wailesii, Strain CCMP2513" /LENGTH=197 /DNA_ID=CAMNT_0013273175 /DNA_START=50 /DNA_END=643 /DNA_ORIENTATION=+
MNFLLHTLYLLLICEASRSQRYDEGGDYQDYANDQQGDNLYANYVNHQAEKAAGGGGIGWATAVTLGAGAWFLGGKVHSKRAVAKVKKAHAKEQKEVYLKFYSEILALQQHNAELTQYIDELSRNQLDEEFLTADIDQDNKVSRAEFNMYKQNYLKKHPEMAGKFPAFEDFDPDHNGLISKAEYDQYYRKLAQAQRY